MAEKVTIRGIETTLESHKNAVRFYPSLYSKIIQRNYGGSVIFLGNISPDALEVLVGWINRHQHDVGRTVIEYSEDPVAVTLTEEDEKILKSVDKNAILEIVQAADKYDMMDLLDGACQIAAPIVEDMSPAELKAIFFSSGDEEGFLGDDDEL